MCVWGGGGGGGGGLKNNRTECEHVNIIHIIHNNSHRIKTFIHSETLNPIINSHFMHKCLIYHRKYIIIKTL